MKSLIASLFVSVLLFSCGDGKKDGEYAPSIKIYTGSVAIIDTINFVEYSSCVGFRLYATTKHFPMRLPFKSKCAGYKEAQIVNENGLLADRDTTGKWTINDAAAALEAFYSVYIEEHKSQIKNYK